MKRVTKKILTAILTIAMTIGMLSSVAWADTHDPGNVEWKLKGAMNGWTDTDMESDGDGIYTLEFTISTDDEKFEYCIHYDDTYIKEKDYDDNGSSNNTYFVPTDGQGKYKITLNVNVLKTGDWYWDANYYVPILKGTDVDEEGAHAVSFSKVTQDEDDETTAAPADDETTAAPADDETTAAPADDETTAAPADDETTEAPQGELMTVYVYNALGWDSVYIYGWNGADFGGWPGMEMEPCENNEGWYKVAFPITTDTTNIIFNCGEGGPGNQTVDITEVPVGTYWYTPVAVDGAKADFEVEEAAPEGWVDEDVEEVETTTADNGEVEPEPDPTGDSSAVLFIALGAIAVLGSAAVVFKKRRIEA